MPISIQTYPIFLFHDQGMVRSMKRSSIESWQEQTVFELTKAEQAVMANIFANAFDHWLLEGRLIL